MGAAFVLIKTHPGRERDVYVSLDNLEAVLEVHVLYGEHDLIVRVGTRQSQRTRSYSDEYIPHY